MTASNAMDNIANQPLDKPGEAQSIDQRVSANLMQEVNDYKVGDSPTSYSKQSSADMPEGDVINAGLRQDIYGISGHRAENCEPETPDKQEPPVRPATPTEALEALTQKALNGEPIRVNDLIQYVNAGLSQKTLMDLKDKALSGEPIQVTDLVKYSRNEISENSDSPAEPTDKPTTPTEALESIAQKALNGEPVKVNDLVQYVNAGLSRETINDLRDKALSNEPVRVNDLVRYAGAEHRAEQNKTFEILQDRALSGEPIRVNDIVKAVNAGFSEDTLGDMKDKALSGDPIRVHDLVRYVNNENRTDPKSTYDDLREKATSGEALDVSDLVRYAKDGLSPYLLERLSIHALSGDPVTNRDLWNYRLGEYLSEGH